MSTLTPKYRSIIRLLYPALLLSVGAGASTVHAQSPLTPLGILVPVGLTVNAGAGTGLVDVCYTPGVFATLEAAVPPVAMPIGFTATLADCGMTGNQQQNTGLGPSPVLASATYAVNPSPTGESFQGTAKARASYGVLGASAATAYSCPTASCGPPSHEPTDISFGMATFTDQFVLLPGQTLLTKCPTASCPPPKNGDGGYFRLTFTVTGSASPYAALVTAGEGLATIEVGLGYLSDSGGSAGATYFGQCGGTNQASVVIACPYNMGFTYNVPFNVTVGLAAAADASSFGTNVHTFADFYDTATLTGIQVFDNNGLEWGGWTITASSGTQYGPTGD